MNSSKIVGIVTGGGRGLGKAIALELAKRNIKIVICSRTKSELKDTKNQISDLGGECLSVVADVRKSKNIKSVVDKTLKKFGRIDILINNAGIAILKPLHETTESEWDDVIDTNLKGTFLFCKEVVPIMLKQQNGIIVNISSGAGKQGFLRFSAYCASKFGVIGLSESLACEVKENGIKVFTICPGSINTKMYSQLLPDRESGRLDRSLLKPEYVAERIIQICLQNHKFETGSVIEIYD